MMGGVAEMDDGAIAEQLGHVGFMLRRVVLNSGQERWYIECGCGYRCTQRMSQRLAVEAGVHHLRKSVAEFKVNGVSQPGNVRRRP
jgi:hypothetical protein